MPRPRHSPTFLAAAVMLLGMAVLAGWAADLPRLTRLVLRWPPMQPWAAVGFVFAGLALHFFGSQQSRRVRLLLLPVAAIAAGALVQHWGGFRLGMDELLFREAVLAQRDVPHPGRMAEITAVEFLLFCLFLAWPRHGPRQYRRASLIATLGLLASLVALSGYLLGAQDLARIGGFTTMAYHAAVGFVLLFIGGLWAQRDANWLHRLLSPSVGGRLARQLLGHIAGWPVLLGILIPIIDPVVDNPRLELAIYVVALTLVLIIVVLRFAKRLDRAEAQRSRARAELGISERRLAGVLTSTMDAVITIDEAQRIVYFNPAAEATFGCPVAEALGSSIDRFIPERYRLSHAEQIRRFGETGATTRSMGGMQILCALRKDGSEFPIEASISEIKEGSRRLFTVILRDITERRNAERLLRQQAMLLDLAPDPIMAWEDEGGIVFWNRGCKDLYGYSREEALGRSSHDLLKTVFPLPREDFFRQLAETGRWSGELQHTTRDGEEVVVSSHMLRLEIDQRTVTLEANRSITETKRLEAALRQLNRELEERIGERTAELTRSNEALLLSNMELRHFAHAAAHDLQTPLRSITGFTQLIQESIRRQGDARVDEWAALVIDNTRRLQTLIQELLNYSRLDVQGLPFEPVDLGRLFDEVLASLSVLIDETGAQVSRGSLPTLPVDRAQVAQLFQNLVENGIKYNHSRPPRVAVTAEFQEGKWLFSVEDNGIGIDPRHHERIFEIFRRLHSYTQVPGTGIGLALCRRIVERHGGHIWVESRAGAGSTFYFTLAALQETDGQAGETGNPPEAAIS